jgi:type IV pilus assembly protein PilM
MSNFLNFLIQPASFGLDIGLRSMKVVQITDDGQTRLAKITIAENSFSREGIKDKKTIAALIRAGLDHANPGPIKTKFVHSALPESLIFSKFLNAPENIDTEIDEFITKETIKSFPMPASEIYIDWQYTDKIVEGSPEIVVVAAPKIVVDDLVETIKMAGLELLSVETKPIAICRALINKKDQSPQIIMDIGARTTTINCIDNGSLSLTSLVHVGGDDLTVNLPESVKALYAEIKHTTAYYQNKLLKAKIFRKIVLAGGGANILGIAEELEKITRTQVIIGQPRAKIKVYNPEFAVAIGLAQKTHL